MSIFNRDQDNPPSAVAVLEEVRKHLPLHLLVELVEAHYRRRRNGAFMWAVGILATIVMGSAATLYTVYASYVQQAETRTEQAIEAREIETEGTERAEARQRTATRIDFVRSLRSFRDSRPLPIGEELDVVLSAGERRQFRISGGDVAAERYEVRASALTAGLEPLMYLYKRGSSSMDPVESNNRRGRLVDSVTFAAERGVDYYLEVEELVGDVGSIRLGVSAMVETVGEERRSLDE